VKLLNWQVLLGLFLILISAMLYLIHYAIFRDPHHIFLYLIGDIAFLPIEVLLVTLIVHQLLDKREKKAMLKKLNMVIGAFFSEVGTDLLKSFSIFDPHVEKIRKELIVTNDWPQQNFAEVSKQLQKYGFRIEVREGDLEELKIFLIREREFLLGLLENPNLLEHESFTDLLWAVFHLAEELAIRASLRDLPDMDYEHLAGDLQRAYSLLVSEWLSYMKHLREDYPYLFSLAIRMNPFDPKASPEIR